MMTISNMALCSKLLAELFGIALLYVQETLKTLRLQLTSLLNISSYLMLYIVISVLSKVTI